MSTPRDLPPGLRAFIEDEVALLPTSLSDADRKQLLEELTARGDVVRVDRLGSSPDKVLAKAARKAVHLLRTRGAAPAVAPRVFRVSGPYAAESHASYASIVDGRGERVVWCVRYSDGVLSVYEVEMSESAGLLSLTAVDLNRKAWRERVALMKSNDRALVGEITEQHARVLIERAYLRTREQGRSAPDGFAGHHLAIQASAEELAAPHPLREFVGEVGQVSGAQIASLLDLPAFGLLAPPNTAVTALDAALGVIADGKPDAEQAPGMIEEQIVKLVDEHVDAALRARLADRFLELGLLTVDRQGAEEGAAAARLCVAAADLALDMLRPAHDHPLFIGMFRRLVPAEFVLDMLDK